MAGQASEGGELRAADRDREDALALLAGAAGDGRLALEEYSERADRALVARTLGELAELTRDLERVAPHGGEEPMELRALLSSESQTGVWRVPRRLSLRSVLGSTDIELQDALLSGLVTTIEATVVLGSITIVVPDGVEVRLSGGKVLAEVSSHVRVAALPGAPVIEVRTRALLGSITVRPPSPTGALGAVRGAPRGEGRRLPAAEDPDG